MPLGVSSPGCAGAELGGTQEAGEVDDIAGCWANDVPATPSIHSLRIRHPGRCHLCKAATVSGNLLMNADAQVELRPAVSRECRECGLPHRFTYDGRLKVSNESTVEPVSMKTFVHHAARESRLRPSAARRLVPGRAPLSGEAYRRQFTGLGGVAPLGCRVLDILMRSSASADEYRLRSVARLSRLAALYGGRAREKRSAASVARRRLAADKCAKVTDCEWPSIPVAFDPARGELRPSVRAAGPEPVGAALSHKPILNESKAIQALPGMQLLA